MPTDLHDRIRREIADEVAIYVGSMASGWVADAILASPVIAALVTIAEEAAKRHRLGIWSEDFCECGLRIYACLTRQALNVIEGGKKIGLPPSDPSLIGTESHGPKEAQR
jgi:hypothetical protein